MCVDNKWYFIFINMNNINNFLVYCHISPNGKKYIGVTHGNVNNRWYNKGKGYSRCPHFYNAIQKHGWDNFEHKVLIHGLTEEQAYRWEIKLIKHYKSNNSEYGYNISDGGKGGSRPKGSKLSEEHKLKISLSRMGEKNPSWGKLTHNAKKILCVETKEVFLSIRKASIKYNIPNQNISKCCHNKRNTAGGYHWKFI